VIGGFGIQEMWEVGRPENFFIKEPQLSDVEFLKNTWLLNATDNNYQPNAIDDLDGLPCDRPLVVVSSSVAQNLKGEQDLQHFTHPEDAIYIFGGDATELKPEDFKDRDYATVYIPTGDIEMYSFQAGAITFYDRMSKLGKI